jgi:hypothetical protein
MKAHEYIDSSMRARDWIARWTRAARLRRGAVAHRAHRGAADRPGRARRARDEEFFRVNTLLLRNPASSTCWTAARSRFPAKPGELPCGLMIWQSAMRDDTVLNIALQRSGAR